ncbi:chitin-binding protein [Dyella sp. M7H15-1]|uniref:lytic polysaccharide monooxygenase n=1 Tax=Dyella sp. M7H15-1 TaxID=2501295 RepID=UPI0010052638|nr:lytic polysaccharide monooxygenase [Dyella sp. M7H15-1]QAU24056.1 chitin-binding protein [Dyella sp. M7H15-1]
MKEITHRRSRLRTPWRCLALFWLLVLTASTLVIPMRQAVAHGAVGFPISRQYQCRLEGNYWGDPGQVPSADCRQAYIEGGGPGSGHYPFQQWNELSANPVGWGNDQAELEKAVPDGLLCAAGDLRKAGLDKTSATLWRKTKVTPKNGKIDVVWENTQDHNPAKMRIYLSKPSYDPSKPLHWADLQKIYDESAPAPIPANGAGHLPGDIRSFYVLHVPIPAGRTGDAVLYSYWQREDAGNEGFFNCSDVSIQPDEDTPSFPWFEERPYLPHGFAPKVSDQVRFRVMGGSPRGPEVVDVHHPITPANLDPSVWAKELADILNTRYRQHVQIGVRVGDTIHYDPSQIEANGVWLKTNYSSAMSIVNGTPPEPGEPVAHIAGPDTVQEGSSVTYSGESSQGEGLTYSWALPYFEPHSGTSPTVTTMALAPPKSGWVTLSLTVTDQHHHKAVANESVVIVPKGLEPVYPTWRRQDVGSYTAGTKVKGLDGGAWECKVQAWCQQSVPDNWTDAAWPYAAGSRAAAEHGNLAWTSVAAK